MKKMEANVKLIQDSGILDEQWYLKEYPDVLAVGLSPAMHYLTIGAQLGRHPGPAFDADWYLRQHKDVARTRINPLLHYLTYGRFEGREIRGVDQTEAKTPAQVRAPTESDSCFTLLPAAAGRLPDLFELRASAPGARIAIVSYSTSAATAAAVDAFLQQQLEDFDHIDVCPTSMPLRSRAVVAVRCKRKMTVVYPDRYGAAAPFVHLVDSGVLARYDAICWIVSSPAGEPIDVTGADRIAGIVRDQGDIGLVSEHIRARSNWGGPEVKRLLATFLPRLGRKLPAEPLPDPIGDVVWIHPLLLRQLRAVPVRPDELLEKEAKPTEVGRHAVQALLAIFAAEGGMAVLNCDAALKRLPTSTALAKTKTKQRKVKAIAFYLPQYHPIPENDLWWGRGFTEWNNVARARPMFRGHYQPRVPADLGYYDLRLPEVREHQARLAQDHGVHGLCYYYYWFNGKKLLNQPIEQMLASGTPNLPFCVCWANENWSRNWDGQNRHVLLEQQYSMDSNRAFIREMISMMKDPRYIRHHGKPVLLVYRIRVIPNWLETAQMWREECRRAGIGEIHLCAVRFGLEPLEGPPAQFGVDSYVLFPPHETRRDDVRSEQIDLARHFNGELFSYDAVVDGDVTRFEEGYPWPVHRGAMMGWDNTARRLTDSRIFTGSTPARFRYWLDRIVEQENRFNKDEESLVFINAWNEWAEGTYLEPDQRFGTGYLSAVKSAFAQCDTGPVTVATAAPTPVAPPPAPIALATPMAAMPAAQSNVKRGTAVKPAWHAGAKPRLDGAPTVLFCAHISGHQLFGGERSFLDVLDAMGRMHLNVVVTLPSGNNTAYVEEVRKRSLGVHVFAYPQWVQDRPVDEALTLVFADIIARNDVDMVHANTIVLLEPLVAARRMRRQALVHSRELITLDESLRDRIGLSAQEIIRRVFAISDYVIGNSLATVAAFRREGRTFYVNNAVRPEDLDLSNKVGNTVRFAVVSSNIPKKGVADFLEVARLCEGQVDNAQFLVIGPENKQTEEWHLAQERGEIPASVKFMGYRDTPRQAMVEAHVVLNLSSFAESFGRTVAEALAARRPVIAYEWGALPELIDHGVTGYLAPYRDTQAVAERVIELCRDPSRIVQMGEKGRAAMREFTPDALHRRLLDAYQVIFARTLEPPAAAATPDAGETIQLRGTTIVVSVYNACEEVRTCLDSVLRNTDLARNRVIVINDGSTDPRVAQMLETFRGKPGLQLRANERNLGYTKTVNIGLREAGNDDVVLLNSDTVVTPQWLEGLRSTAYGDERIGTVTAMSDNAGAFSFPVIGKANPKPEKVSHDDYAATIVQKTAGCAPVEVPTGSGFCMYIRRDLVAQIGEFDEKAFPRGYGEENDFCMRAIKADWRNLITPRAFVFHVRSASFGEEKAKLAQAGVDVVTRRYPDYARLTKEAFTSPSIRALQQAVASAVSAIGDGDELSAPMLVAAPAAVASTTVTAPAENSPQALMQATAKEERWLKILTGEIKIPDAPVMPDQKYQRIINGRDGRQVMADAMMFRNFMKSLLADHARPLAVDTRILEFGCGWGRILRTFLDVVSPEYLVGIDAQEWLLDIARQTTRRPGYDMYWKTAALPAGDLPADTFDLVYAYSVFSHLSEKAANAWIAEFSRILAPGGIVCVTTRPRKHIQLWENTYEHSEHTEGYAKAFANAQQDLARYDRGEFVFHPGGSHELVDDLYGEAVVPEAYARGHWTGHLEFIGYFEDYASSYLQPAIVLQKKAGKPMDDA